MFNKIIVPVDMAHQEHAGRMIAAAREVANTDSTIVLCNVVETLPEYALTYVPGDVLGNYEADARAVLDKLVADHGGDLKVMVRTGHPAETILQVADDENADAVVIASHKPGFSDYFIGSTAARVVRHAKCSVLVLR